MTADDQLQPPVSAFIAHLSNERQLSSHTVDGYQRDLKALQQDIANQGITDWRNVAPSHPHP
ncbi:MAG: site-specific integrase [Candidatus Azotimanducaceae bacterium WSBS_2022_MAG_OTU7]